MLANFRYIAKCCTEGSDKKMNSKLKKKFIFIFLKKKLSLKKIVFLINYFILFIKKKNRNYSEIFARIAKFSLCVAISLC